MTVASYVLMMLPGVPLLMFGAPAIFNSRVGFWGVVVLVPLTFFLWAALFRKILDVVTTKRLITKLLNKEKHK